MKRIHLVKAGCLILMAALLSLAVACSSNGGAARIDWASTSTKSGFYAYWVTLSRLVEGQYPEIEVSVIETSGGLDNMKRLMEGTVDLGGYDTAAAYAQYAGVADYADKPAFPEMRSMWGGFILPINIFVRADSDVYSLEDLDGKPFSHIPGSSADRLVLFLFEANGIEPELVPLGAASALDAVRTGAAVGSQRLGIGDAAIVDLTTSVDLRFIPITPEQVSRVNEKYPKQVYSMTLPAGSYPGQDADVQSLAYSAAEYTTTDLSADVVYKIVKAVYENRDEVAGIAGSLATFDTAPWELGYQDVPLHEGALKFFRELGVEIDSDLIPPEAK